MCSLFAHQPEADHEGQTRSLRIGGRCTSIRLEAGFWAVPDEMADAEGTTVGRFRSTLHDEVLAQHGQVRDVASLLRCACPVHLSRAAGRAARAGSPGRPC